MDENELDDALQCARDEINNVGDEEIDEFNDARVPKDQEADIFEQGGEEISKKKDFNRSNQLPPVMGSPIFQVANITSTSILTSENLWNEFEYFELTEVMRQKDERNFIQALNNSAYGHMKIEILYKVVV